MSAGHAVTVPFCGAMVAGRRMPAGSRRPLAGDIERLAVMVPDLNKTPKLWVQRGYKSENMPVKGLNVQAF
jgi:hypothetical protein